MNIYDLSRNFWNYAFDNPDKIKPVHTAMFFYAIEHCNRLGWKEKFGLPTTMAMEAIGVKSYNTFIKTLNELVEFGFIIIHQRSRNQYTANIIALSKNDKAQYKALDEAIIKHSTKQDESTVQSTCESIDSIDKQSYNPTNTQTHTHSQECEGENPKKDFPDTSNSQMPQSPGCAAPPFPGTPFAADIPEPPSDILQSIAGRQFQKGYGVVSEQAVLEYWHTWAPVKINGQKFFNHISDVYDFFFNSCQKLRIAADQQQPKPRPGNFQNGNATGAARGRGASFEEMRRPRRRPADDDPQRDGFTEVEIVE